ncbi:hypothetical protein ACROAE_07265 [Shewanella sp. MF05960]|uniref:hypothetical protein n=1 Tax=Shewanella sp. MF05960 TaxID=3434874 RepID=UPI003D78DB0E
MFKEIDDIYNYIGQEMYERLPEYWDIALLEVNMDKIDKAISIGASYILNNTSNTFDLDEKNGVVSFSDVDEAFYALYKIMQKNESENDVPWNKARFEITSEGDFSIDFKYDEDFVWYKSLDIDSQEYDDLDIDIINQIETWEGLPETAPRYWKNK